MVAGRGPEPGIGAGPRSAAAQARASRPNDSVPVALPDFGDSAAVTRWRQEINATWGEADDPRVPHQRVEIGGVSCLVAGDPEAPAVVYAHGGGYCLGSAAVAIPITARVARPVALPSSDRDRFGAAGVRIVSVDYRLAPEHPFPAAVDDVVAVCDAIGATGGYAAAGDSAGAGIVLAAAIRLRDEGRATPRGLALLSPHVDFVASRAADHGDAETGPLLDAYRGAVAPDSPAISPLRANLDGLPPVLLQVAHSEAMLPQGAALARRLRVADVPVDLDVWAGMWHTWHYHDMPEADRALAEAAHFLRSQVLPGP